MATAFPGYFPENKPKTHTSFSFPAGAGNAEAVGAEVLSGSTDRRCKSAMAALATKQTAVARYEINEGKPV